jgi:hypothetical protein
VGAGAGEETGSGEVGAGAEPAPPPALPGWLVVVPPSAARPSAEPVALSAAIRLAIETMAVRSPLSTAAAMAARASSRFVAGGVPGCGVEAGDAPMS